MSAHAAWLAIEERDAPLILSFPHTGTEIPPDILSGCVSKRRALLDTDWWIETLYAFGREMGASYVRTGLSRTVIDVNRDPSGVSLYPGQATTGLVPLTTFDGDPLWVAGREPDGPEIARRRTFYFDPYHQALADQIARLKRRYQRVVLYDCHSIRSVIPRLFDGELPVFNIGTNTAAACAPKLQEGVEESCAASGMPWIVNGRFKGGYITRFHGRPENGVHAVQMELACRGYMREPIADFDESLWPSAFDADYAAPISAVLQRVLETCLVFAHHGE
jgi:N-formylglutamate deformylase